MTKYYGWYNMAIQQSKISSIGRLTSLVLGCLNKCPQMKKQETFGKKTGTRSIAY